MAEPATIDAQQAQQVPMAPSARAQLAQGIADVLSLPDGRQTASERAFAAEILAAALLNASLEERRAVASRLASVGGAPPSLLRQLLTDEAPVATPLLTQLTNLSDTLLMEAATVSTDHRLAIAGRDGLSEVVVGALLAQNEPELFAALLPRPAPLPAASLDAAVVVSRSEPSLLAPLIARPDLQLTQALTLFWWCEPGDRRRLLTRFAVDRTVLQDLLQPLFAEVFTDADPDPVVKRLLHVIDRRHRPRGRDGEMVTMEVVERTLMVARAGHTPELCEAVGLLAGVSTPCATRVLHDESGEPFALLAKSIGVGRGAFAALLDGAAALQGGADEADAGGPAATEAGRERMMACFDIVTHDYARAVLRYWDWRPDGVAGSVAAPTALAAPAAPGAPPRPVAQSYLGAL